MRKGSMALIGKIFRKDSASYLVIEEARETDKLVVRRIDARREMMQMTASEVLSSLQQQQA